MVNCCVPLCFNHKARLHKFKSVTGKRRSFHTFPLDEEKKREWLAKIRRPEGEDFKVTQFTRVCSAHFEEDDYKKTFLNLRTNTLKPSAVPSVFKWTESTYVPKPPIVRVIQKIPYRTVQVSQCGEQYTVPPPSFEHDYIVKVETSLEEKNKLLEEKVQQLEEVIKKYSLNRFCLERFSNNDNLIKFYTGFPNYSTLKNFFLCIESYIPEMVTWLQKERQADGKNKNTKTFKSFGGKISPIDQLFMFLNKLRLGSKDQDLADKFLVSQPTICRTIKTWTNFLYFILGSQPLWPSKHRVPQFMPKCFQEAYPNVKVMIDTIEMVIQNPSKVSLSNEFYSRCKERTTVKGLIGFTPGGAVCFVSHLYPGSISDNSLVSNSGILDLLEEGDEVMASKDFQISDLIKDKKCTLVRPNNLPTNSMVGNEAINSRYITDIQVCLGKAIQRLKQFRLFESEFSLYRYSVNQLWIVACLISNFQCSMTTHGADD